MGLEETGHIARIVADPHDADVAFVCAVGQAYRPQHERGIFRTTDGGKTWQQVLFVDENTGCSELSHGRSRFANAFRRHVAGGHQDVGPE